MSATARPRGVVREQTIEDSLAVRPARPDDAPMLAPRLRAADLREIAAATHERPVDVLARGIADSRPCYAVVDADDRPVAVFGVVPDLDCATTGIVWLLGSDTLTRHAVTLLRASPSWIDRLQERYTALRNCVDARNSTHIRWLRWCRFEITGRIECYGVERRPFLEFVRYRSPQ